MCAAVMDDAHARKRACLWFRNDCRLHDNAMVQQAVQLVQKGQVDEVVPVYFFDPRFFGPTPMGDPRTGPFRSQFLLECIADLRTSLQALGSDLWVYVARPEDVLPSLLPSRGSIVLASAEVTSEETNIEKKVKSSVGGVGGKLQLVWNSTMYHLDDLPFREDLRDLPDVFTPFKQKVEQRVPVRALLPSPKKGELPLPLPDSVSSSIPAFSGSTVEDLSAALPQTCPKISTPAQEPRGVLPFKGGESVALERLKYYLWDSDLLATYFDTRNGMLGGDYSTKFAPWMAAGCLSPRLIYHEIRKYETQRVENKSTYWVIFECTWRDFFRFFALKHGNKIFFRNGVVDRPGANWSSSNEAFQRWRDGQTGWPLVDANMRELKHTGFMSNRGRQNVASFLALDMAHDWRDGAWWFESVLLDYDVASNWGNWVAAAGLTGGRINKFNITKQSKDYDADGEYVRHWIPELAKVPSSRVHEPWLMSKEEQNLYGCEIGTHYPAPLKPAFKAYAGNGGQHNGKGRGSYQGSFKGSSGGYRGASNAGNGRGRGGRPKPKSDWELYG